MCLREHIRRNEHQTMYRKNKLFSMQISSCILSSVVFYSRYTGIPAHYSLLVTQVIWKRLSANKTQIFPKWLLHCHIFSWHYGCLMKYFTYLGTRLTKKHSRQVVRKQRQFLWSTVPVPCRSSWISDCSLGFYGASPVMLRPFRELFIRHKYVAKINTYTDKNTSVGFVTELSLFTEAL